MIHSILPIDTQQRPSERFGLLHQRGCLSLLGMVLALLGLLRCERPALAEKATSQYNQKDCEVQPSCIEPFRRGSVLYDAKRFDAAIVEFESAYDAVPLPLCLYYVGRSHDQLGRREAALAAYRRYLSEEGKRDVATTSRAEGHIARLEATAAPNVTPPPKDVPPIVSSDRTQGQPAPSVHWTRRPWIWAVIGIGVASGVTAIALAATWPKTPPDAIYLNLSF